VFVFVMVALRRRWWLLAAPLYVWVIHEGLYTFRTSHFPLAPHIPTFLAGSLAAFVYARVDECIKASGFEFATWQRMVVRAVEGFFLCVLLSIGFKGLFFHWVHENPVPPALGFPFVSVPVTIIMVIEMVLPSALSRALEWNFLCFAGKVSFSMYLLHSFVIYSPYVSTEKTRYDLFFAQFGLIFLLSTASYWLIEYPSQLVAQRISKKMNALSRSYDHIGGTSIGCFSRGCSSLAPRRSGEVHV
jgi:peptidoglycan/LPS O-acetylase OafA/YrhL